MAATALERGALLLLALACAFGARAGPLEDTCASVRRQLGAGPHARLTTSSESFVVEGRRYRGCVVRLSGDARTVTDRQRPEGLFGGPLPYCPGGRIPPDLPRDLLNPQGWCGDRMADGPDGTSYLAHRGEVVCAVEGRWDGGDDSAPRQPVSPRYEVVVKCANR